MPDPTDDYPALAVAMQWVSWVTTVSLEMVVPAVVGYWLDRHFETRGALLAVGAVLGFVVGMSRLLKLASSFNQKKGVSSQIPGPHDIERPNKDVDPPGTNDR